MIEELERMKGEFWDDLFEAEKAAIKIVDALAPFLPRKLNNYKLLMAFIIIVERSRRIMGIPPEHVDILMWLIRDIEEMAAASLEGGV